MYDILIVGGGLVGASLVLGLENHLSSSGLKIGLVDSAFLRSTQKSDNRTIVLSDTSLKILQSLSDSSLDVFKNSPIEKIHISKKGSFAITRLKASDINIKALGYSVEMSALVRTLYEKIKKTNCELIGAQVKKAESINQGWKITLEMQGGTPRDVSTRLLIAADGDHSILRTQLAIPISTHEYSQSAWVTKVQTEKSLSNTAFERFISHGSLALLPICTLPNRETPQYNAKLVWIGSTEFINELEHFQLNEKKRLLKSHMGSRVGNFLAIEEPGFVYPLKSQHTPDQIRESFVLMGNAAHVLHPIGAQGFNLSLRDVVVLVENLSAAENIFSSEVLQDYLSQRIKDQKYIEAFTHGLNLLSETHFLPFLLLNGLELLPPMKRLLIRFAMGSLTKLPRWVFKRPVDKSIINRP